MKARLLAATALSLLALPAACGSGAIGGDGTQLSPTGSKAPVCATSKTDEVRQRLAPACVGCHGEGSNKPFFADLVSFEQALVYDTRYVVPGKPEESYLTQLLEGTAKSIYKQMPPNGPSYSALPNTDIPMSEIKQWITDLPPPPPELAQPDLDAPTTRRLTAEEIVASLQSQLGLEETDFADSYGHLIDNAVPVWSPDAISPGVPYGTPGNGWPSERFLGLGGPFSMHYQQRERAVTPAMIQVLFEVSQAWCGLSVKKTGTPLLRYATLMDTSVTSAAAIKKNLTYLHVRMLGEADAKEVDSMYKEVFLKYEPVGADVAWQAVCSALVRHPRWISL
jgi:hypothetical protein